MNFFLRQLCRIPLFRIAYEDYQTSRRINAFTKRTPDLTAKGELRKIELERNLATAKQCISEDKERLDEWNHRLRAGAYVVHCTDKHRNVELPDEMIQASYYEQLPGDGVKPVKVVSKSITWPKKDSHDG